MSRKRWSIPGWLTRWLALTVGVSILSLSSLSAWFVRESVERELDALVLEELHEMRAELSQDPTRLGFERLTLEYAREHPANPLAWRAWTAEPITLWGEFGPAELLAIAPTDPGELDRTIEPKSGFRWRTEQLDSGLIVGILVDGAWQFDFLRRLTFILIGFGAVVATVTTAGGVFLGRRLAGHLHGVADQVREVHAPSETQELSVEGAPEEIREVADALCEMLAKIRREQDRAQLMSRGLAHELRSPIQNLMGEAEVSLLRNRSVEEYRAVLESQVEELRDLGRVVDNLVMLCSPSQSEPLVSERFNLKDEASLRL
ncbi:MAG: two-component system heavy metal sensor histidine kinase CusS, partial [Planctomycetota bacterium]